MSKSEGNNDGNQATGPRKLFTFFDNVVHYERESVLSNISPTTSFVGFKNLAYIMLAISIGRIIFENALVYGIKASPISWIAFLLRDPASRPTFYLYILTNAFPLLSLMIECLYVQHLKSKGQVTNNKDGTLAFRPTNQQEWMFLAIYNCLLVVMVCVPIVACLLFSCNWYLMAFVTLNTSVTYLKLYSYHQVNSWWRTQQVYGQATVPARSAHKFCAQAVEQYAEKELGQSIDNVSVYPDNLSVGNMVYFFFAPTLCYQANYPRAKSVDWVKVVRYAIMLVFLIELECMLYQQWILTPLKQKQFAFDSLSLGQFILQWCNSTLGLFNIWLIGFYTLFHVHLNLVAEVMRFGDRKFYEDWWNAESVSEFWRRWNMPVHHWCVRHVYKPMCMKGYSKLSANIMVFFVSGIFHEYFTSVPLRMFRLHFFWGMLVQVLLDLPFSGLKSLRSNRNFILWTSLMFSQSFLVLLYTNDLTIRNRFA